MSHPLRFWILLGSLCFGCGALAPEDYLGERVLSVHGSAQLDADAAPGGLQVAIAFVARDAKALRLMGAQTQGEFPNVFTLDLYDRPPVDALITAEDHPEWGRAALGLIAAVPPDHAEYVDLLSTDALTVGPFASCHVGGCICAGDGCKRTSRTCLASDREQCYTRDLLCPENRSKDDACRELGSTGDESIAQLPWSKLAGLSQNYVIVYLERAAPAGGYFAKALSAEAGLPAGYHLVTAEAVPAAPDACDGYTSLPANAALAFNQAHGTRFTAAELRSQPSTVDEFEAFLEQARLDSGCRNPKYKLIAVASDRPISVRLGKVLPLPFLNL